MFKNVGFVKGKTKEGIHFFGIFVVRFGACNFFLHDA